MKNNVKYIASALLIAGSVLTSCNEWTDTESIDLNYDTPEKADPAGYAEYIANLREYRNTDHKKVYAWFDVPATGPENQSQRLTALPDSVDVVVLENPVSISETTKGDISRVASEKGMKAIYVVDYDAIKSAYALKQEQASEAEPLNIEFNDFLVDSLATALSYCNIQNLDGICIAYTGKSTLHLTSDELKEYTANERTFIGIVNDWHQRNPGRSIDFLGKPQNVIDKELLNDCGIIFLSDGLEATNANLFTYYVTLASVDGVPTDRIGMAATYLDANDPDVGYFADGTYAVSGMAEWAVTANVAGVGFQNMQQDYFNRDNIYPLFRELIQTVNPAIK